MSIKDPAVTLSDYDQLSLAIEYVSIIIILLSTHLRHKTSPQAKRINMLQATKARLTQFVGKVALEDIKDPVWRGATLAFGEAEEKKVKSCF